MSNLNLVNQASNRCHLRVPAVESTMQDTRARYATTDAAWLHITKFGPNHHSQRWRPAS